MKNRNFIFIANTKQGLFALVLVLLSGITNSQTYTFALTGNVQTLTLVKAGFYDIECWGADGGEITVAPGGEGKGGYAKGTFNSVSAGATAYIYVGGKGAPATGTNLPGGNGGWNGGGGGGTCGKSGGGGGGATDIRINGTAASDRVIVAGGGGGSAYYNLMCSGGHGGGQVGQPGDVVNISNVYTTGAGGAGANGAAPGVGGYTTTNGTASGGGGGGWSGGGVGQPGAGGGAGGFGGNTASGATGGSGGGGGGYAGGAGGTQTANAGVGGGGGSSYIGGVSNGTTVMYGQPGFVYNPTITGDGYIIITYRCDVTAHVSKNPICVGEQVILTTDAGSNIQWSHGPTTASVVVSPSVNTSYTVSGVTTATSGCSNTIVINVTVNPLPSITAVTLPTVLCQGQTGTITASGAASYTWSPGGNDSTNILITNPSSTTIYTLEGLSAHGCYNTATVSMEVNTNQLLVSPDTTICEGSPAYLRAYGALSYNWIPIGAPFQYATVYPTVSSQYSVAAIDEHNCPLGEIVMVTVNPRPTVGVAASRSVVCRGEVLELYASGATSYAWSDGSTGSMITPSTKYDLPINISVTGTDDKGCTATASITVVVDACVSVNEQPATVFRLMPNPTSSDVTIESNSDATWSITDLAGRILLEGNVQKGSQSVDVSRLASGVYLVRLQTVDSERTVRLIKN